MHQCALVDRYLQIARRNWHPLGQPGRCTGSAAEFLPGELQRAVGRACQDFDCKSAYSPVRRLPFYRCRWRPPPDCGYSPGRCARPPACPGSPAGRSMARYPWYRLQRYWRRSIFPLLTPEPAAPSDPRNSTQTRWNSSSSRRWRQSYQ